MRSCLVIDDSGVVRKVVARILASLDLAVDGVANTREAAEFMTADRPDLVLVSGTSGDASIPDFVRGLRAEPAGGDVVILAMLVEANLGQMTRLKRAGVDGFLLKPFDRKSFIDRIGPFVESRRAA